MVAPLVRAAEPPWQCKYHVTCLVIDMDDYTNSLSLTGTQEEENQEYSSSCQCKMQTGCGSVFEYFPEASWAPKYPLQSWKLGLIPVIWTAHSTAIYLSNSMTDTWFSANTTKLSCIPALSRNRQLTRKIINCPYTLMEKWFREMWDEGKKIITEAEPNFGHFLLLNLNWVTVYVYFLLLLSHHDAACTGVITS